MAKYPAVQKCIQDGIDCTVGQTNMPCLDDKPHLMYTNAVIHEAMRIETIIPTSLPHYAMQDSYIQGKKVDKDTVVLFNLHSLAHDATVWRDPTNFLPDIFLKEDGDLDIKMLAKSHPFSLGHRRCTGEQLAIMNIFLIFSGLMKKYTFELYENAEVATIPGLVYAPDKFKVTSDLQLRGFIITKAYPDGPWGFPIVGHLPWLGNDTQKTFADWQKRYGDVFRIRLGSWPTVVVNGHKAIHDAAVTAGDAFFGRPNFVTTEILRRRTGDDPFAFGTFSPAYLHQKKITTHALRLFTKDRKEFVEELITSEVETLTTNINQALFQMTFILLLWV
ncbi:CP1B1-like protein [Mya arenaria]|uniref:CP1B1-like protein n=1 Tax=Mya arenaria TaxID=6604 RepID=A0ABY7DN40_MYAAR|nr:CP1B1-like protein [Mya arenaria]